MSGTVRRWGDNDRHFGPFTYSRDSRYRPIAVVLSSEEDEYPGCNLRMSAFGRTLIIELPGVVKPYREKIIAKSWDAATVERLGRDWYWNIDQRQFGFSVSDGFLQVFRGRRTMDSSTDRTKGYFLPWKSWRFVRHSLYDLSGDHFWTEPKTAQRDWRAAIDAKALCPTISFGFDDFDGERIIAKTLIEEREWKLGEGRFKWLSAFCAPKVNRSLDIQFSKETGQRKGSWKGGTVGHSIEMLPGELHEAAFRRYCTQNAMTYRGIEGRSR